MATPSIFTTGTKLVAVVTKASAAAQDVGY